MGCVSCFFYGFWINVNYVLSGSKVVVFVSNDVGCKDYVLVYIIVERLIGIVLD